MIIKFQKFQGAGNDFIIIDNRNQVYEFTREIVEYFCDRKFGIGADGLMLLETCPGYDFKMRYFNSDGREASLCGNGSRCIVAYAHRLGLFLQTTRFLAADGEHQGEITLQGVRVKMNDVSRITVTPDYFFLDTGSPHYVKVVADAFQTDVVTAGRMIRYAPSFQPGGTNVNFITPTPACIRCPFRSPVKSRPLRDLYVTNQRRYIESKFQTTGRQPFHRHLAGRSCRIRFCRRNRNTPKPRQESNVSGVPVSLPPLGLPDWRNLRFREKFHQEGYFAYQPQKCQATKHQSETGVRRSFFRPAGKPLLSFFGLFKYSDYLIFRLERKFVVFDRITVYTIQHLEKFRFGL